eukprot:5220342-Lingulodinium_polyedra.AAC.1
MPPAPRTRTARKMSPVQAPQIDACNVHSGTITGLGPLLKPQASACVQRAVTGSNTTKQELLG